jgi:hypothetical protein
MTTINKQNILEDIELLESSIRDGFSPGISNSNVWFVKLKESNSKICLKIHIAPESIATIDPELYKNQDNNVQLLMETIALDYEMRVYKQVQILVDYNICPNFIGFYNHIELSYQELMTLLNKQGITNFQIHRNIYNMRINTNDPNVTLIKSNRMSNKFPITYNHEDNPQKRRRIESIESIVNPYIANFQNYKYKMLITETFDINKYTSLHIYLYEKSHNGIVFTSKNLSLIFQSLVACYALSIAKIIHNDLMASNVLVRELENPETVTYIINDIVYTTDIYDKAYIYDYDRSYSKKVGPNTTLIGDYSKQFTQSNTLISNKDAFQIIQAVYKESNNIEEKAIITKWLGIEPFNWIYWTRILNHRDAIVQDSITKKSVPFEKFEELNSIEEIIYEVALSMKNISNKVTVENLYIMNPCIYDNNNTLDKDILASERIRILDM